MTERLGVQRLAELLMDIAEGDAVTKRRLRLELTAQEAPETMAAEVRKRLTQIARARSYADWRKVPDLPPISKRSAMRLSTKSQRAMPGRRWS